MLGRFVEVTDPVQTPSAPAFLFLSSTVLPPSPSGAATCSPCCSHCVWASLPFLRETHSFFGDRSGSASGGLFSISVTYSFTEQIRDPLPLWSPAGHWEGHHLST